MIEKVTHFFEIIFIFFEKTAKTLVNIEYFFWKND